MKIKASGIAFSLLVLLLSLGAAPASAAQDKLKCELSFSMTQWAAVYEHAVGTGTVHCDNGAVIPVDITSKGGGLTAGKFSIEGTGKFGGVEKADDVLGKYVTAEGNAGLAKSGQAALLTNGDVSLAIAGKGSGWNVGISLGQFTIERRK